MFEKLSNAIKPFAPLLSTALSVLPVPGAQVVGKVLEAAFDGNIDKPDELAHKITLDPNAALKLAEIESNNRVQLENIAMQQAYNSMTHEENIFEIETSDRKNARELSAKSEEYLWVDPLIKLILVAVISFLLLGGLMAIVYCKVEQEEANLLGNIMGGAWTIFVAIGGFYWGTSFSSRQKDDALLKMNGYRK